MSFQMIFVGLTTFFVEGVSLSVFDGFGPIHHAKTTLITTVLTTITEALTDANMYVQDIFVSLCTLTLLLLRARESPYVSSTESPLSTTSHTCRMPDGSMSLVTGTWIQPLGFASSACANSVKAF